MVKRLPVVNGDDGQWGTILNNFLAKEHFDDGTDTGASNGGHKTITVQAGTATAGTAPLKFTSGTLLTTPEAGAVEFVTNRLYYTETTGPTRLTVLAVDDTSGANGDLYYRNSGAAADLVRLPIGASTDVLTVVSGAPAWAAPSGGSSGPTLGEVYALVTGSGIL